MDGGVSDAGFDCSMCGGGEDRCPEIWACCPDGELCNGFAGCEPADAGVSDAGFDCSTCGGGEDCCPEIWTCCPDGEFCNRLAGCEPADAGTGDAGGLSSLDASAP
ncbi:MAG TPA: hypothetical protein RMH99_17325 [Sandaracinaceae bacterium LLY-WYZ-13_1]|nr:hypothetical protein [Sandaracinaceae bacterium LLY-WYZ-13_1]